MDVTLFDVFLYLIFCILVLDIVAASWSTLLMVKDRKILWF